MSAIGGSVRRAFSAGSALLLARVELASAELQQARDAWLRWLLAGLMACVLAAIALLALATALALALWERFGWPAFALVGFLFLLAAAIVWLRLRREIAGAPRLLSLTLEELARDREAILGVTGRGEAEDAGEDDSGGDAP